MVVGIVTMLVVPETDDDRVAPRSLRAAVVEPFRRVLQRAAEPTALLILAFLFFYKLGDNMAVALQTPFFIDVGFSLHADRHDRQVRDPGLVDRRRPRSAASSC